VTVANALAVGELVQAGLERREARWLVEEFGSKSDPDARGGLDEAARRRLAGEPLQYVLGHWPFRSLDLDLDARVLIPRPETEELVGIALMELTRCAVASPTILDLGCGSGAIGLAILAETRQRAVAATLIASARPPWGFNQPIYPIQLVGTALLLGVIVFLNWTREKAPPVVVRSSLRVAEG